MTTTVIGNFLCTYMATIISNVISIVIGSVIAWAVTHVYYKRAGNELRGEAAELRNLIRMMLTAMERQGWAKLDRDPNGNIIGYIFEQGLSSSLSFDGSLERKHIPAKPTDAESPKDGQ